MRVPIHSWGVSPHRLASLIPAYAMRKSGETPIEAVVRAIASATGLAVCGCSPEGTAILEGKPAADHYQLTLGRYDRASRSYAFAGRVWVAVPVRTVTMVQAAPGDFCGLPRRKED